MPPSGQWSRVHSATEPQDELQMKPAAHCGPRAPASLKRRRHSRCQRLSGLDVIRPMTRRRLSHSSGQSCCRLPRARRVVFKAGSSGRSAQAVCLASGAFCGSTSGTSTTLLSRSSDQRRAVRLRRVFEDAGATFAKPGQQLSMRADMLPYAYCAELGKMLTRRPLSRRSRPSRSSSVISAGRPVTFGGFRS